MFLQHGIKQVKHKKKLYNSSLKTLKHNSFFDNSLTRLMWQDCKKYIQWQKKTTQLTTKKRKIYTFIKPASNTFIISAAKITSTTKHYPYIGTEVFTPTFGNCIHQYSLQIKYIYIYILTILDTKFLTFILAWVLQFRCK